jgi:hypothetical protein
MDNSQTNAEIASMDCRIWDNEGKDKQRKYISLYPENNHFVSQYMEYMSNRYSFALLFSIHISHLEKKKDHYTFPDLRILKSHKTKTHFSI